MQLQELDHESNGHAIPIPVILEAIDAMEYASTCRVMFQMLYLTGCRIQELDSMRVRNLHGAWLYWPLGKNQKGWRKERLSEAYLAELCAYRETHRVPADKLFGVSGETFRGYFKNLTRHRLPAAWQRKRPVMRDNTMVLEYVYQLKGLRKDFQTLDFYNNLGKWGDPGIAIEMTSKRMGHSSFKITARHYTENLDALGVKTLPSLDPAALLKSAHQKRLFDYA